MTAAPRWLVITEEEFLPANTGGRVEHRGFLRAAAAAGIDLSIVIPAERSLDVPAILADLLDDVVDPGPVEVMAAPRIRRHRDLLGRAPYVVRSRPLPPDAIARLKASRPFDAVISYSARVAHLGIEIAEELGLPHLVRCHNRDSDYFRQLARAAAPARRAGYLLESRRMAKFERGLHHSPGISAFADLSAADATWRREHTDIRVLHVPPFLPQSGSAVGVRVPSPTPTVLFTGSLDVESNVTAASWLVREVWPLVRAEVGDARLLVVGRRPGPLLRELFAASPATELHADVPSLTPYLSQAWVSVNPALEGSGVNIKLIEAMAAGLATVSTEVGARGLDWRRDEDLLVADGAAAFARAIVRLLRDEALRDAVGERARAYVARRLDPPSLLAELAAALPSRE